MTGPDQGADLLFAWVSQVEEPCKGDCAEPAGVRYIEKNKVIDPLPKMSDPQAPRETVGRGVAVDARPFRALNATFGQPMDFSVPILEYPQTIAATPRAVLHRTTEGFGVLNPSVLQLAFHDPVYGDVWTTKPGLGPQKAFYEECKDVNPKPDGSEQGCDDLPQYTDNAFYFFRPDGTYLRYVYTPDFKPADPQQVTWNDGPLPNGTSYDDFTVAGCEQTQIDDVSVVPPSTGSSSDLIPIAKVNATSDLLYGLNDKHHPIYQEFYGDYESGLPKWASEMGNSAPRQLSYDDFVKSRPLFLWKDPFGRLVRFVNTQFVTPLLCEPIVYLYPPQEEKLEVELGRNIVVANSFPVYRDGWIVAARPNGALTDLRSGSRSPYLFWEGRSYILPPETRGFVVKNSDISIFLEATLPKLGLNARESGDFISAWSPKFTDAPYYFITFVDKAVIDRFYPLQIYPPPDTVIRVLMDFAPLYGPVSVQPQFFAPPAARRGFTVVEWGAVVR